MLLGSMLALAAAVQNSRGAACPATPAPLPASLAGWPAQRPIKASTEPSSAGVLAAGHGARAALSPVTQVTFPVRPAKPGPGAHGGLLAFEVARAGRYRIALTAPAWIEVVEAGRAVPSATHGHGPACSGVRKMVDFDLKPGRHLLEIAGAPEPTIGVLLISAPAGD